jgi:thioredoxin reductase/Fe-S-cluster-containing hydrogenase component 2/bacterioferritin-associated ferredoxin
MDEYRILEHPILPPEERADVPFTWQGRPVVAKEGETVAAALFANGIRIFGHHAKDGAPQGIFCANGQCAQCAVFANRVPVKACMTLVEPGMAVEPMDGLPVLPEVVGVPQMRTIETVRRECLIIGGGPSGLAAAIELGKLGVHAILVDDKHRLGGKLVLQTHKFFGSIEACYAGTRGIDIAAKLEEQVRQFSNVNVWLNSTVLAVFSDGKVGVLRDGKHYVLVEPRALLVATGAREKSLVFKGNTLPGVYGAGAFQTLVNRDRVRASRRLFVVGGGNVGLIAAYHALQAGIQVVGLVEALPECSGYKVHKDKLARMGVPIYTSYTVVSANGDDQVESVTIAQLDKEWKPIPGTERSFACDTVLVAVGLDPVDEFVRKAQEFRLPVWAAGDAEEIAEASAAMFTGKIRGLEIARFLDRDVGEIPTQWLHTAEILKSKPGITIREQLPRDEAGVVPILHCSQERPCNPCTSVCPKGCIRIEGEDIRGIPHYTGEDCSGCGQCVGICPGLAITLVDYRKDPDNPTVTVAYEFLKGTIAKGDVVTVLDTTGHILGNVEVVRVRSPKTADRAQLVDVRAPREIARQIAGILVQEKQVSDPLAQYVVRVAEDELVCRCERVAAQEIRALIRDGVRDMNQIKALTRAGMGACGGKTCTPIIKRLFGEESIPMEEFTENTQRPLFIEVPLGIFAGVSLEGEEIIARPGAGEMREGGF